MSGNYVDAWESAFADILKDSDLAASEYSITNTGDKVVVRFYGIDELVIDKALVEVKIE